MAIKKNKEGGVKTCKSLQINMTSTANEIAPGHNPCSELATT